MDFLGPGTPSQRVEHLKDVETDFESMLGCHNLEKNMWDSCISISYMIYQT